MPALQCSSKTSARLQVKDQKRLAKRQPQQSPQQKMQVPRRTSSDHEGQWLGSAHNLTSRARSGREAHIQPKRCSGDRYALLQARDSLHILVGLCRCLNHSSLGIESKWPGAGVKAFCWCLNRYFLALKSVLLAPDPAFLNSRIVAELESGRWVLESLVLHGA